ncbi:hypothetical protein PsYK624_110290 [Phanerochaete sordida]|uniref:F-box domain-containing protein n=1 Tax=Phanerochaete sordida TaxID=48140 RepID=A0A9P3GH63_9APHY|nr:hypothetical protein PsYK624_110290 [Phanerochaete sordida]
MDSLPVETCTHIFLLACTDGGATGCALSQTCRYFRAAVLPVQLHSVALIGGDKCRTLLDVLENRLPEHRRVEHLFISQQDGNPVSFDAVVQERLLTLVAPTLRTFTSTLPQKILLLDRSSVLAHAMPMLEELTMHGYLVTDMQCAPGVRLHALPALRRLHLLSAANAALVLVPHAPRLAALRISGAWSFADALAAALLRCVQGDSAASPAPDAPRAALRLPPTLARVVLAPDWTVARAYYGSHRETAGMYRRLQAADRRGVLTLLEPPRAPGDARGEWEERIGGGDGCWGGARAQGVAQHAGRARRRPVEV